MVYVTDMSAAASRVEWWWFISFLLFRVLPILTALLLVVGIVILIILLIRRSKRNAPSASPESAQLRRTLAEILKEHRTRCKMTQEFVAESVGVSRQAVSKWELGASEPSTTNLIALAKLYGTTPEELLAVISDND